MRAATLGRLLASAAGVAVAAGIALAACAPQLPGDGHFACGARGECPSNAPYCHADRRCHAAPEADGGTVPDGGESDGGTIIVRRCGEPVPACTASERCVREAGELEGYCASMASGAGSCPGGVATSDGYCRIGCAAESDCVGTDCTFGRWEAEENVGACAEAAIARPTGYAQLCTADTMCPRPLQCVSDRCMRHCDSTGDTLHCGPGEICGPLPGGSGFVCLVSCSAGETCPEDTMCESPGGPSVCLPLPP